MDTRLAAAAVIVRLALDSTEPEVALMVTVPDAEPVAIPPALTLAIFESEELHNVLRAAV